MVDVLRNTTVYQYIVYLYSTPTYYNWLVRIYKYLFSPLTGHLTLVITDQYYFNINLLWSIRVPTIDQKIINIKFNFIPTGH